MNTLIELQAEVKAMREITGKKFPREIVSELTPEQQKRFWELRKQYFNAAFEKPVIKNIPKTENRGIGTKTKYGVVQHWAKMKTTAAVKPFMLPVCGVCGNEIEYASLKEKQLEFCDNCWNIISEKLEHETDADIMFEPIIVKLSPIKQKQVINGQKAKYKVKG